MPQPRKPVVTVQEGVTVIELGPEYESLDGLDLDKLSESLLYAVDAAKPPFCVLDMRHTRFFGSAFIEVMFRSWKRLNERKGEFAVSGLTTYCREVIEVTNLDKLWKVTPTIAQAVAHLAPKAKAWKKGDADG